MSREPSAPAARRSARQLGLFRSVQGAEASTAPSAVPLPLYHGARAWYLASPSEGRSQWVRCTVHLPASLSLPARVQVRWDGDYPGCRHGGRSEYGQVDPSRLHVLAAAGSPPPYGLEAWVGPEPSWIAHEPKHHRHGPGVYEWPTDGIPSAQLVAIDAAVWSSRADAKAATAAAGLSPHYIKEGAGGCGWSFYGSHFGGVLTRAGLQRLLQELDHPAPWLARGSVTSTLA